VDHFLGAAPVDRSTPSCDDRPPMDPRSPPRRLFVYGTMLSGEADHQLLVRAKLVGPARTTARYLLVETNVGAGLLEGGDCSVVGELYELDVAVLGACDVHRQHPLLYERRPVELEGAAAADAYFLRAEQARGRRRLRGGDWRARFDPAPRHKIGSRGWRR
jgi:gamma-glutamylcyclotransferase (GGCT)/AIG2-like uncharacterized protein YtfP